MSTPGATDDPQLFTVRPDGSDRRQISSENEGIDSAVLSGSGLVAWAVTRTGRFLKYSLASGISEEIIGPVAAFRYLPHCPGTQSQNEVDGGPAQTITAAAFVMPGDSVQVLIGDQPVPILNVGIQQISFAIPENLDDQTRYNVSISKPGDPRWIPGSPIPLRFSKLSSAADVNGCSSSTFQ